MPVVGISTAGLKRMLHADIDSAALAEAIDRLGCDLKDLAEVNLFECPACGNALDRLPHEPPPAECDACGHRAEERFPLVGRDERVYLELLPARPDLFNATGLARALSGYLGRRTGLPDYAPSDGDLVVEVDPGVLPVRPHIAAAEVTFPPLTREALVLLFRLQEDLHWGVGRGRGKASIGAYDLSALSGRILYTVRPPDFAFTPLGMPGRTLSLSDILAEHPKGRDYAALLHGFDRYPILMDSAGRVLSMPPIINSEETRLREGTTRVFIDVTGTDRRAVEDCLALLVSDVCEMGGAARTVRVVSPDGERRTPDLAPSRRTFSVPRAARLIGVPLDEAEARDCLLRMRFGVEAGERPGDLTILVPRYRVDVRHEVDIVEDVAIAWGYHRLPAPLVPTMTVGEEHPKSALARRVRSVLTGLGFFEVVNFVLTNREEHYAKMGLPAEGGPEARILNPISPQQEIVRTHLLSGLMADFALNKTREMPQGIFEIGEVVTATDAGAAQRARVAVGVMGPRADYATVRSVADALAAEFLRPAEVAPLGEHPLAPAFLDGRAALMTSDGAPLGVLGEVDPTVITAFGLDHPIVLAEFDLAALGAGPR